MDVRNLHETPVTETQLNSRSMMKAFSVAASKARSQYGVRKNLKAETTLDPQQLNNPISEKRKGPG